MHAWAHARKHPHALARTQAHEEGRREEKREMLR
jgi:hypothetical protein